MIEIYDGYMNRMVKITSEEANGVNICREYMLQAKTFAYDNKNVDSFFALAKVERDKFVTFSNPWGLCENAIQDAAVIIMLLKA